MSAQAAPVDDPVVEYMLTFFEWRERFGFSDACIDELRAAALVESERDSLSAAQRRSLLALARLIEEERRSAAELAA